MHVNKAEVLGNLGETPVLRYTKSGGPVTNLRVATTHKYRDKSGQQCEETEWHRVVVFGRQAESCTGKLYKGRQVRVEGRLRTRAWEDKEGNQRYTTEIVAKLVDFGSHTREFLAKRDAEKESHDG